METIYALVIILSASLVPEEGSDPNLLSGEVEQKTTVYFKTLESCQASYNNALATKDRMATGTDATVIVKPCEGIQVSQ